MMVALGERCTWNISELLSHGVKIYIETVQHDMKSVRPRSSSVNGSLAPIVPA